MDENQHNALIGVAVTFYIFGILFLFIGYGVFIFIKCHQWNYHSKLLSDINRTYKSYRTLTFSFSTEGNTCIQPNTRAIYCNSISSMDFLCSAT